METSSITIMREIRTMIDDSVIELTKKVNNKIESHYNEQEQLFAKNFAKLYNKDYQQIIIDLKTLRGDSVVEKQKTPTKKKVKNTIKCAALKKDGSTCSFNALKDHNFCKKHMQNTSTKSCSSTSVSDKSRHNTDQLESQLESQMDSQLESQMDSQMESNLKYTKSYFPEYIPKEDDPIDEYVLDE